jgi:hypothetical protein
LYEQGKEAVRVVLSQIQGLPASDVFLRTELVTRRSCGCVGTDQSSRPEPKTTLSLDAQVAQRRPVILADLVRSARATFGGLRAGWEGRLLSALTDELNGAPRGTFLTAYSELLQQVFRSDNQLDAWHDVLSTLRRHVLGMLVDPDRIRLAEDLFHAARVNVSNMVECAQASKRLEAEDLMRQMARTGAALIATFDETALFAACHEHLPPLGVHSTHIIQQTPEDPGKGRVLFSSNPAEQGAVSSRGPKKGAATFSISELLPGDSLPRQSPYALVVEPLFFRGQSLGYAVFGFGPRNGTVYESLRDQISAALYGAKLRNSLQP